MNLRIRGFGSQAKRLWVTKQGFWRWLPMLVPWENEEGCPPGLKHIDLWLALACGRAEVKVEGETLNISFAGRENLSMPMPTGPSFSTRQALREVLMSFWRNVRLLDQYDAVSVLGNGMVVIDAGANVGCFSLLASSIVGSEGKVIAIEPMQSNFTCLEDNIRSNRLTNVVALRVAVGDHNGEVDISVSEHGTGTHSAVKARGEASVVVPLRSVDSMVAEMGLDRVDFIKADVEGMEPQVLAGAAETIRRFRPHLAFSAYHVQEHRQLLPDIVRSIEPTYSIEIKKVARGLEEEMFAHPRRRP